MSNLILNLRIGKLHIQIDNKYKIKFVINPIHKWIRRPIFQLYDTNYELLTIKELVKGEYYILAAAGYFVSVAIYILVHWLIYLQK